ncbi:MAG: DUF6089 family protein [Flavobacteriales bacterium]|jgi:hypothetical protein|nr:MAG: DUF6089 family protein [Flavobacteriales bacterium]
MHRWFLPLLLILNGLAVTGQVNELGLTVGATYYIGDLNPYRHYPKDTKLAGGIVFRHNLTDRYALRLQGLYGTLQAYDSDSPDSLQQLRNLHFRAPLFEASLLLEINFFKYRSKGKDAKKWTPFVFGGLAYFRASPKAQLDDTWYDLQQLGTEGQSTTQGDKLYAVDHMAIPFGAGLKLNAGRIDFQLEWGMRRTWTDYIDDVSGAYFDNDVLAFENGPLAAALADRSGLEDRIPGYSNTGRARGDANTRDWYVYSGLTITYVISRFSDCDEQYNWMKRRR